MIDREEKGGGRDNKTNYIKTLWETLSVKYPHLKKKY